MTTIHVVGTRCLGYAYNIYSCAGFEELTVYA